MDRAALPFSIDEYRSRLEAVRRNIAAREVEVLLVTAPENIYYLTGYHSLGYFTYQLLIVPLDQDPILLTRFLNVEAAQHMSWLDSVTGYTDVEDVNDATYNVLARHGFAGKRLGSQDGAWFFTVAQHRDLVARLGGTPVDCTGVVEQVRLIKSPQEIEYIREAGRCCAASIDAAVPAIAAGATENDVAAAGHAGLIAAGSEYLGHAPMFVTGPAAGLAFETYKRRSIQTDDVFYIEAGGTFERYNAALSRTVIVGNPDAKWIRMAEASCEGLARAKAAIRAGVTAGDVDKACRDHIADAGYAAAFQHRTGYSIGIGFPPDWGEGRIQSIKEDDPTPLEAGMVFHLIPDLKVLGAGGVVFSETVLVTENGCDVLTRYSDELIFR